MILVYVVLVVLLEVCFSFIGQFGGPFRTNRPTGRTEENHKKKKNLTRSSRHLYVYMNVNVVFIRFIMIIYLGDRCFLLLNK